MKINGIDVKKYNAKQLTVAIHPASDAVEYEWITGAVLPIEFDTDIKMGSADVSVYFKGKNRDDINRRMSEMMALFTKSCILELDGYKGKFMAYRTSDDFENTISKERSKLNLKFDGFFFDEQLVMKFDGVTIGKIKVIGSRKTPCIVEVTAKKALKNYVIKGIGTEDIVIETLDTGKTIEINGETGRVTSSGENAFDKTDIWEFPKLETGQKEISFSSRDATVKIKYKPMWI